MKKCPTCSKSLRVDNTRGACAECINIGKAPRKPSRPSVAKRFRATAKALGQDPGALVEEFMEAWLLRLTP